MGVIDVKTKMFILASNISTSKNSLNNTMIRINSSSIPTLHSLPSVIVSTIKKLVKLNSNILELYKITSLELHIFFKEYNKQLNSMVSSNNNAIQNLEKTLPIIIKLYTIYYLRKFFKNNNILEGLDIGEIKKVNSYLQVVKLDLDNLSKTTIDNNSKLIIKNNRG